MERCVNCMIDVGEPCQCSCTCERRESERRGGRRVGSQRALWFERMVNSRRRGPDRRKRDD